MDVVDDAITADLKTLRKGRGLLADRLTERVGSALRQASGIAVDDSTEAVRQKVRVTLVAAIEQLPPDLRIPLLAAFALDPATTRPSFYQERINVAAERLQRDPRTVRRRIDDGITQLAEIIGGQVPRDVRDEAALASPGWYTAELQVFVNLDLPSPEVLEFRRIVAEQDHVDRLDLAITATTPAARDTPVHRSPAIDVFSGGKLTSTGRQGSDRMGFTLNLPVPLRRGNSHDFALRFHIPDGGFQPHYVCVPRYRCDKFNLTVRFGQRPPDAVWRLTAQFQRDLDDPLLNGEPAAVSSAGEIQGDFKRLAPGLAYGFRWRRSTDAPLGQSVSGQTH